MTSRITSVSASFIFIILRHEFAQRNRDAATWRISVGATREFAPRVHQVNVGTMVDEMVFVARSGIADGAVGAIFPGDGGCSFAASGRADQALQRFR